MLRTISASLTVTLPLSNWFAWHLHQLSINQQQSGINRSVGLHRWRALDNDSLEWSLQQGYSNREYYSGDMRGTYNGARGSLQCRLQLSTITANIDYGANGSIVAHADGIAGSGHH